MFTAIKKWLHRMFGKTEKKTVQPVKTKKKLSRADKKQIEAAIARANRTDKKGKSAQDSIPYERMWPDGICRVSDSHYTKTIQFQDINYQLSQNEDKTAIFEGWCDFLNYFDSSIHFQLSFLNLAASEETFANSISIPPQGDAFDSIREEYTTMLQNQLARGNNGLIKTKYLTFGIDADSIKAAKPRLERIETDILNNFKRLGVAARTLDGKERLSQLHAVFHMDEQLPFQFEWDWLAPSGLSTKDFIAPSSFEFRTGKQFRMGKKYGAVSFLQILAPELNDRLLADFLDMESSLIVSMHIQSVDQVKAIKTVKRKITDLDRSKIEEQKKAVRAGYDIIVGGFETTDRRDFFDLAIGNVPFGQYQVNDKAYNKLNFNIHNYFFAKALDQVRPGGVVAFVTSRYTMDAKDSTVRRYLAQRAELLGAIRLPNDAFKKNAGAEVVSDIIFLQKRDRPLDIVPEWTQTGQTEDGFAINRYFIDHPEMVLGRQEPVNMAQIRKLLLCQVFFLSGFPHFLP